MFRGQRVDIDLAELLRNVGQGAADIGRLQPSHQQMAGADLGFAEKQGCIVPAAVEDIDHRIGDTGHVGFVLAKAVDDPREVGHELAAVELVVVGGQAEVGVVLLQDVEQPVGQLDIAVARALGVAQGLDEGIVAGSVELARYGL